MLGSKIVHNSRVHCSLLSMTLSALLTTALVALSSGSALAVCVSGFVRDSGGNGIRSVDIDFFDVRTGAKLITPNDNTDVLGFYNICVLPGVYYMAFDPPIGTRFMGKQVFGIDLSSNQSIELNVTLASGLVVSGTVRDAGGNPIFTDIDADSVAGGRVHLSNDFSDSLTAQYWIVVPAGQYRFRFDPPVGSRSRGLQLDSVTIDADTTIDLTLPDGLILSGHVTSLAGGIPIPRVSIDLRHLATGLKIYLANDKTDTTGFYTVAAPPGQYELRFSPPTGTRFIAFRDDTLTFQGDMSYDVSLREGVLVTVQATDSSSQPVGGVDIDFKLVSTGEKIFTPGDVTNVSGTTTVAVAPDTYDIELDPPLGLPVGPLEVKGVTIDSDTTLSFVLPDQPRILLSGRVIDSAGSPLAEIEISIRSTLTGAKAILSNNTTASDGAFAVASPVGLQDIYFAASHKSHLVGNRISAVNLGVDTSLGDITLESGHLVTIEARDQHGRPFIGLDYDFLTANTPTEIFTPWDKSDSDGVAWVSLPTGAFDLRTTYPGAWVDRMVWEDLSINSDTSIVLALSRSDGSLIVQDFFLYQNYPNPFIGETIVSYMILVPGNVSVEIYNVLGQLVVTLADRYHPAGVYHVPWGGRNGSGDRTASGVYFVNLRLSTHSETKKLVLLK
ncbi:MAG: T9SS type A sorting domain-containing protein [Candidatus Zixiibacteriota bacterium]